MTVEVEVGFVAVLRQLAGAEEMTLDFEAPVTIKDVVSELTSRLSPAFKHALMNPELDDPRPNVIILVNEREIGVLQGLETRVDHGDRLKIIPVSHGG